MMLLKNMRVSVIAVLMVLLSLPSLAQAECKGMSKSSCEKSSQCSYVKGYTTKSGSKIAAYCRNKAKKGASSSASSSGSGKATSKDGAKKADSSKTADKKKDSKKKDSKKKDSKKNDSKKKDSKKKDVDKT